MGYWVYFPGTVYNISKETSNINEKSSVDTHKHIHLVIEPMNCLGMDYSAGRPKAHQIADESHGSSFEETTFCVSLTIHQAEVAGYHTCQSRVQLKD